MSFLSRKSGMKTMTYYSTDIGTRKSWAGWDCTDVLYFANLNGLMDHLQAMYKCTANEIELSAEWNSPYFYDVHNGSIDAQFCQNHNSGKIDCDLDLELGAE